MPYFICPNCKERSIDIDRMEGLYDEPVACHHCGFGFLFELLDDYYPAPGTGFVVCDKEARILAVGRGVFELTGWSENDLLGVDLVSGLGLAGLRGGAQPGEARARMGRAAPERAARAADPLRATRSPSPATSSRRTTTTAACSSRSRRAQPELVRRAGATGAVRSRCAAAFGW